ncbi:MAG: hypothetical protein PHY47_28600 [Lachnospiraceae bacterium]|nr:hypothetical protein [Lachnospiraceae bacterium]
MSDVIERIKDRMIKRQEAMEQDSYSTENKARILESKATLIIIDQEMAKEPHAQPIVRTAEEIVKRQVCDSCSACTGCYEEDKQLCEYAK